MGGRGAVVLCLTLAALAACGPAAAPASWGPSDSGGASPEASSDSGTAGDEASSSGDDAGDASSGSDACSAPVATPQILAGEIAAVDQTCGAADGGAPPVVGPVPPSTNVQFDIGLPVRNQSALNEYLQAISDPSSPQYRQYLTSAEYDAMFSPTVCDYDAVIAWAEAQGFTVTMTYSDRLLIDLSGTAASVDAAFHVTLTNYLRRDGTSFYAPDVDPSVNLAVPLLWGDSLDNCAVATPG